MEQHALRQANMAIAERYLQAINDWDFDVKRELLAPDVIFEMRWAPPGFPRRIDGVEAVMEFLAPLPEAIVTEGLHDIRLETLHSDAGQVVAFYKSDMKMVRPVEYKNDYITCFTIRDGRIVRFCEYFDPIPLVVAFGGSVVPPSP
ncbi:nuclear transport factor 2 family protein [Streptomyces endophyticus]|uniref:Nuclear transport factor 2 family protein n=1 Tax=Streptomyces endophyticus TaxID=714166 RepID=A0ABU6F894_9ACTN|nr:nuclear transport factor 2 family protein [Streptomyces endophyticus]MEB8340214.1 nuclear transport factor 2 family protein [Streptomyces endophyticus]